MKKIIIQLDKSTLLIKRGDAFKLNLSHNVLYEVKEENDSLIIKETKKSIFKKARVELVVNNKLDSLDNCLPCGYCRQFMSEFVDKDFKIYALSKGDKITEYSIFDLLPNSFRLSTTSWLFYTFV